MAVRIIGRDPVRQQTRIRRMYKYVNSIILSMCWNLLNLSNEHCVLSLHFM